jgi:hypothetical protein
VQGNSHHLSSKNHEAQADKQCIYAKYYHLRAYHIKSGTHGHMGLSKSLEKPDL